MGQKFLAAAGLKAYDSVKLKKECADYRARAVLEIKYAYSSRPKKFFGKGASLFHKNGVCFDYLIYRPI